MSNVIAFLEALGKNPALAEASNEDYAAAVDALGLDDAPRQALLARDATALNDLLGGRSKMVCALFPADGETPEALLAFADHDLFAAKRGEADRA